MKTSFTLSKIDDIKLKNYNIALSSYKSKIKRLTEILFKETTEINKIKASEIFKFEDSKELSSINFDIAFCLDSTIKEINKEYRKKDKATDVITFSLFFDDKTVSKKSLIYRKKAHLGQIIVSVETAKKQSEENKISLEAEILTLICHGILHLLGFDHLKKRDYDFVVEIQTKVIKNLMGLT